MSRLGPRLLLLVLSLAALGTIFLNLPRSEVPTRSSIPLRHPAAMVPDETPAIPTFTLIDPGLYVGTNVIPPPPDATAILCLSETKDPYTAPVYQWSPIPDAAPAPSLDWLREQVAFIDEQRRAGRTVFVHCDAGISRSPMVAAAYLMWLHHWTCDQALDFLRKKRPIISPNDAFLELLKDWERSLYANR
jgi:hypothetical protein